MYNDHPNRELFGLALGYVVIVLIAFIIVGLLSSCSADPVTPTLVEDPTPTIEVYATPTPVGLRELFRVRPNGDFNMNIRMGPGLEYSVLPYKFYSKETFIVFDANNIGWYGGCVVARDETDDCAILGWIASDLTEKLDAN